MLQMLLKYICLFRLSVRQKKKQWQIAKKKRSKPGGPWVVVLDEVDAVEVGLVVNVLHLLQDHGALGTLVVVWLIDR